MPRPIHQDRGDLGQLDALGLGKVDDVLVGRRVEVDGALGVAGANGDFFHVAVRRMQQRARFGQRESGDRAGHVHGAKIGPFERINGDVYSRAVLVADLFADEKHGSFIEFSFTDHHCSIDGQLVELPAHGVDGGLIGRILLPEPT